MRFISIKHYLNDLIPLGEGGVTGNSDQADSSELLELSGLCGELLVSWLHCQWRQKLVLKRRRGTRKV